MDNITKAFHELNVALRRAGLGVVCMLMLWRVSALEAKAAAHIAPLASADSTFTVASFRQLPTDVSAFIDAVRDLNGEACALLKVVAPSDFAFSSPLGIVRRRDEVGEIWLYLPKGTKSITLKHPQWGVLRNYSLGTKLESRMTYEMRLHLPQTAVVEKHDTIVYTQTVVDTVTVAPLRRIAQLHAYTLLTASMHTDGPSWGIMAAVMRRHGVYLHASRLPDRSTATICACCAAWQDAIRRAIPPTDGLLTSTFRAQASWQEAVSMASRDLLRTA